ncbi:bifunctional riboflavin kinase/FAD synthetase [Leifsonia bigeumensis]|uniref:Riboflavin biosynthesis protein n=1 Tax=Leifsonella bigeumensis TaxID=433643 RepID=A0ABP7FSB5_9MICO
MKIYTSLAEIPTDFGPSAVTIGKFDGVHIGHHRMIDLLLADAREASLTPTVLTFDRNPLSLLAPEACPPALISNDQKLELLERSGVAATVMLTFDRAFSQQAPEEFIERVLVRALRARIVFAGPDFRFGHGGKGTVALLDEVGRQDGFEVRHLPIVEHEGRRISSTWVRELLAEGRVREAAALLGRRPAVRGAVVRGAQRGRMLGFPTANLAAESEGLVPADGIYAAWATVSGDRYPAAVSIGNNPTFEGVPARQVEAHLLAADSGPLDIDLYGRTMELDFVDRIRGMEKFDGADALIARITADVEDTRRILVTDPAS